jgi:hypothetical protein
MTEDGLESLTFSPLDKCLSLSLCPWHSGHHHLHSIPSLQTLSLRANGWLCGSDSSPILWIPPEHREGLSILPAQVLTSSTPIRLLQVLISSTSMTSLNLQNFVHGTNWAQCYTGKELYPVFHCCFSDHKKGPQIEIDSCSLELLEEEIARM